MPQKQPISIMPSRPMLITPLRLGDHATERREQQRRRIRSVAATSADQVNTDSSVDDRRVRRCGSAGDREQGDHDRLGSDLALAAGDRPRAGADGEYGEHDRRHHAAHLDRRDRDHPRDRGEDDARDADLLRRDGARGRHGDRARAHDGTALALRRPSRKACAERHADPPPALQQPERDHVGRHEQDDDPLDHERQVLDQRRIDAQVDVAIRGAGQQRPNSSAAATVPPAVFRPSRATAIP